MATKERFDRKELKEPDSFFETVGRTQRYIRSHQTQVVGTIVGVVAVLLAIGAVSAYIVQARTNAAEQFARAIGNLEYESPAAAKVGFEGLVGRSGAGPYAALARLYKADLELRDGNYETAISDYESFRKAAPAPYLEQIATMGKAFALEQAGRAGEAAEAYAEASSLKGPYTLQALEDRARTAEESGDTEAAVAALEELLEKGGAEVDGEAISRRIEELREGAAAS